MKKPASSQHRTGGRGQRQGFDQTRKFYARATRSASRSCPDFATVKARMDGHWLACLFDLATALHPALARPGRHVPCPVHGGADGFRVFKDVAETGGGVCNTCGNFPDGFALIAWVNSWTLAETLKAVARWIGLDTDRTGSALTPRVAPAQAAPAQAADPERERRKLAAIWSSSSHLTGPALAYLACRGLADLERRNDLPAVDVVRFHLSHDYWTQDDGKPVKLGAYPALVCRVQDPDGGGVALHLTYLQPNGNGKAAICHPATGEVLPAKKLRSIAPSATNGGAIRLYPAGTRLAVAEGIETALAVRIACPDLPVWAAVSAGGMARLIWPDGVTDLLILADNDESQTGQKAAKALANRAYAAGVRVRIAVPATVGSDWADVLQEVQP